MYISRLLYNTTFQTKDTNITLFILTIECDFSWVGWTLQDNLEHIVSEPIWYIDNAKYFPHVPITTQTKHIIL